MRNTHPTLYKIYIAYAILSIALGLNFLFLTPTFMPLDTDKWFMGLILLGCGSIKLMFLLFNWSTQVRLAMAVAMTIYSFWAAILTFDFFRLSQTSLQLPFTYIGLAVIGLLLLLEPFINPVTAKSEK